MRWTRSKGVHPVVNCNSVRRYGRLALSGLVLAGLMTAGALMAAPHAADKPSAEASKPAASLQEWPMTLLPQESGIGRLVADVSFTDITGKAGKLSDFKASKATVIAVTSATCPISRKFGPRLAELQKRFAARGVEFLFVNLSPQESRAEIDEFLKNSGVTGRYVHDKAGQFGHALGVKSTADVFIVDSARTLRYRGPVDDQYGIGYSLDKPRVEFLAEALEEVLAGRLPNRPAWSAPGCELEFKPSTDPKPAVAVTYHGRISRIIQQNCQACHREGGAGPFKLMTYEDVKGNKAMIRKVTSKGIMPPWFADPAVGHWTNDRRLNPEDLKDLLAWIEADMPEGDPAQAPLPIQWPTDWTIGKPDMIIKTPNPIRVKAEGAMPYKNVFVKPELDEDKWIAAAEFKNSQPQVVHHVLVFAHFPAGHPRFEDREKHDGGIRGGFLGTVPGQPPIILPPNMGKLLPKGTVLQFQIHYTPNGKQVYDQTELALIFTKEPPKAEIRSGTAFNARFTIPAGAPNHQVEAYHTFARDTRLLSFSPHMHVRGKAAKYELLYPDGRKELVLNVPRYDFNWQMIYQLTKPIDVPVGTKLKATMWFDNSDKNPANPDPTKDIFFGEQTWDEMMIGYFDYHWTGPAPAKEAKPEARPAAKQAAKP